MKDKSFSKFERLKSRHQIIKTLRDDLDQEGFLEVETPLLVKKTCPDPHIDSIEAGDGFLVTSTEYQIKRLLAGGGLDKVFTLTRNFRAKDEGRYHSSEFTMLEWARVGERLSSIEEDTVRFIRKAFKIIHPGKKFLNFRGREIDILSDSWEHITVREAFKKYLGLHDLGDFSLEALIAADVSAPSIFKENKYLMMSYLLDQLQSHLGMERPTFLKEWPSYLASSAPLYPHDPNTAERTELYIGGIELANGFPFLCDSKVQRKLFDEALQARREEEKPLVALDERYIEALDHLPRGAGMALGVDRLVMVLTEADRLSDVQAFSWDDL